METASEELTVKKSFAKRFWWIPLIVLPLLFVVSKALTTPAKCTTKAGPDPATGGITWTLPDCASSTRLIFPYSYDEVFYNDDTGLAGYGVHAGEHIEGLNHEWIALKLGAPIRSWADGEVESVTVGGEIEKGEIQITIDYGDNLKGIHTEVGKSLVKAGDLVRAGQEIAVGWTHSIPELGVGEVTSGEYALNDFNRRDGTIDFGSETPSTVSPYDYLQEPDKKNLVQAYKEKILDPYLAGKPVFAEFPPYQPYLTNQMFLHTGNPGKLSGEWYGADEDPAGNWREGITFIEADNPYFSGNIIFTRDATSGPWSVNDIKGRFDVDYDKKQATIYQVPLKDLITGRNAFKTYYGIFEINESGDRPTLKLEYQEGSFPTSFTAKAKTYVLRDDGSNKMNVNKKESGN